MVNARFYDTFVQVCYIAIPVIAVLICLEFWFAITDGKEVKSNEETS